MSQVGKYLNLKPHMQSWAVYNENGPYTSANKIGTLAPSQYGGLSYKILGEKGGDVYVIQTETFGRCAIWAPVDNDSSITTSPLYQNGDTSGGGSGGGSGTGKYLNLKPHMNSWAVYNVNGPYTTANAIGHLAPSQFGGLSYRILEEKGNDIYIIQTDSFGRCAIWAPRDNDSSITSSPEYSNGNTSGGGSGSIGAIKKIYIDAGHGGSDSGAIGYNSDGLLHYEKTIALNISLQQATLFKSLGYEVRLSRYNNSENPSLYARTAEANAWGADLFISNHVNAGGGTGIEVWHSINGGLGKTCAQTIIEKLCFNKNNEWFNETNFISRGIKSRIGDDGKDYYHVIRESNMPAIIIEHGFMDNKLDLDKLTPVSAMQHKLARLTVEAISGQCGIRDVTSSLNNTMKNLEKTHANNKPENIIARLADFYFVVRNGSEGDLKNQGFNDDVYFYNPNLPDMSKSVYRNDCPGNISYGYLGMAYDFDLETIQRAAGLAQVMAGTSRPEFGTPTGNFPYGDDPHDQLDIILGSRVYNNKI